MSWIELMGRQAAASMLPISGRMLAYGRGATQEFDFWSAPGGRWRIESTRDLVYLRNSDGAAIRTADGTMQHLSGHFHTVHLGGFDPRQILGLNSLLLSSMSANVSPVSLPQETTFAGRKAWSTTLANEGGATSLEAFIDDETGVLLGLQTRGGPCLIEVTNLRVHSRLDSELFDWRRVAAPSAQLADTSHEAILSERIAILTAIDKAADRRCEVLEIVSNAADADSARRDIGHLLDINDAQASAVLDMQFRRFAVQERSRIRDELQELNLQEGSADGAE